MEPEGKFTAGMCIVDKRPFVLPGRELGNQRMRDLYISSPEGSNARFVELLLHTLFPNLGSVVEA